MTCFTGAFVPHSEPLGRHVQFRDLAWREPLAQMREMGKWVLDKGGNVAFETRMPCGGLNVKTGAVTACTGDTSHGQPDSSPTPMPMAIANNMPASSSDQRVPAFHAEKGVLIGCSIGVAHSRSSCDFHEPCWWLPSGATLNLCGFASTLCTRAASPGQRRVPGPQAI
jgi:hypothetical protein